MGAATPSARTRARERMAAKLAEQRQREQDLQDRLEKFLKAQDSVDSAQAKRDAAIAKAERDFAAAKQAVEDERAGHIAAMRHAGQSPTDIAELTGLTAKEVRALARRADTNAATDKGDQSNTPGMDGAPGEQPADTGVPAAS